jgi:hypothetical protein
MNAYGAPYEIKAVQPSEIEGGANAINMTQVNVLLSAAAAYPAKHLRCSTAAMEWSMHGDMRHFAALADTYLVPGRSS